MADVGSMSKLQKIGDHFIDISKVAHVKISRSTTKPAGKPAQEQVWLSVSIPGTEDLQLKEDAQVAAFLKLIGHKGGI